MAMKSVNNRVHSLIPLLNVFNASYKTREIVLVQSESVFPVGESKILAIWSRPRRQNTISYFVKNMVPQISSQAEINNDACRYTAYVGSHQADFNVRLV